MTAQEQLGLGELVERLRKSAKPSEFRRANPTLSDTAMAMRYGFDAALKLEAADALTAVIAERDALAKIARDLTKGLVQLTPSGSEYFTRHGDEYYADVEACQRAVRERFDSGHKAKLELVDAKRDLRAADAQLKAARESLEKLACRHVTEQPLWWQIEARTALLNTKENGE